MVHRNSSFTKGDSPGETGDSAVFSNAKAGCKAGAGVAAVDRAGDGGSESRATLAGTRLYKAELPEAAHAVGVVLR